MFWTLIEKEWKNVLKSPKFVATCGVCCLLILASGHDPLAAMVFYRMAAEHGNAQAAVNLAYSLIEGDNAWRDPVAGYGWCLVGIERGDAEQKPEFTEDCDYLGGLVDDAARSAGEARAAAILR